MTTFNSFVGNRKVVDRLRDKLHQGRFPHGLIFSGPQGVGKHACALMIAKAMNCTKAEPVEACGDCSSCRKIDSGTHPDVMTTTVEEDATQIKITQVRRILGMLDFQPLEGRNKVFIIDPAERLNSEAASALLKGLEEPPENSFFILVTVNAQELLLTVRSRCQIYNFTPLNIEEIRTHGVTDELVARWSRGSIGQARSLDITRLKSEREVVLDFLETAVNATDEQFQNLLSVSGDVGRAKQDFDGRMIILSVLIADVIYLKEGLTGKIVNIDIRDRLKEIASGITIDRLVRTSEFVRFIEVSLKNHVNRQMLAEMLALTANETASKWLS